MKPHQRYFGQGGAAFSRQAPISLGLRPAKVHGRLQQMRWRKRGQWHRATGVRDVSSAKLVKTKMAKSTLDAGWSMLRAMLEYKSHQAGIVFEVVNESYSTQTCSCCGTIPASSPKGRAGLRIREWVCSTCATVHDRDVNAAKNILAAGHRRLAAGIPVL